MNGKLGFMGLIFFHKSLSRFMGIYGDLWIGPGYYKSPLILINPHSYPWSHGRLTTHFWGFIGILKWELMGIYGYLEDILNPHKSHSSPKISTRIYGRKLIPINPHSPFIQQALYYSLIAKTHSKFVSQWKSK